jgi:hypothetical protein
VGTSRFKAFRRAGRDADEDRDLGPAILGVQVTREISVPADLGPDRAADWFRTWRSVADVPDLQLVLERNPGPTAAVLVAAGVAERKRRGLRTATAGDAGARIEALRPVADLSAARAQADEAELVLLRELEGAPPSPLRMARFLFEELGANVVQHSGAPETGFGAAAAAARERRIEIAFADGGVGFRASLERNDELRGRIADEAEALQLAFGRGLSGTSAPRRNMGMGLSLLQDFCDRLGGDLWLASGEAMLRRRTVAGVRTTTVHRVAAWNGSWICLAVVVA